ncbi:unnamed protein product [Urochloa humidicola]
MIDRVPVPRSGRPSAFRRFPPGCGRHANAGAGLPPRYPATTAAVAAAAKPPLPKPAPARAAKKPTPPHPGRTFPAAASAGAAGPGPGVGNEGKAAATVTVRRPSAVRRYPPGCGRGVVVSKLPASLGEAGSEVGAAKATAVVGNGDAKETTAEFNSNGGVQSEEGGGKPWVVAGPVAVPFLPWAQHGRRSQGPKA